MSHCGVLALSCCVAGVAPCGAGLLYACCGLLADVARLEVSEEGGDARGEGRAASSRTD